MKLLLISAIFLSVIYLNAQNPGVPSFISEATKESGFATEAADINLEKLPPGYKGHNPTLVLKSLLERQELNKKDEFETTEQFQVRTSKIKGSPLFGALMLDSVYALQLRVSKVSYDADNQIMHIEIEANPFYVDVLGHNVDAGRRAIRTTAPGFSSERTYTAGNKLGGQREVTKKISKSIDIAFSNFRDFSMEEDKLLRRWRLVAGLEMPSEEARLVKPNIRVLAICSLQDPYTSEGGYYAAPTFDFPTEIEHTSYYIQAHIFSLWIYDEGTGKIFKKMPLSRRA